MIRSNGNEDMKDKNSLDDSSAWISKAIVYQIFPDRFRRSGKVPFHDLIHINEWEARPSKQRFQGGDLFGVIEKLDYLQDLGVNCIYLNPIFTSSANHRYHTYDYMQVDPLLGGNDALDALIEPCINGIWFYFLHTTWKKMID